MLGVEFMVKAGELAAGSGPCLAAKQEGPYVQRGSEYPRMRR
jgi:hypothetical protein